jgi:hypothetical protein
MQLPHHPQRVGQLVGKCQYFEGSSCPNMEDFGLKIQFKRHMPSGEIVINSSPRGGVIGFSTLPNRSPTPSRVVRGVVGYAIDSCWDYY